MTTCPRCGEQAPEGARFCAACGAPLAVAAAAAERRKVVTVVFADVVGSTALGERVDPETLRWAMQRWFGRMAAVVERHGGTIENYIGDAVMAVFGVPVAHEDDAVRAVRAAAEMRDEVGALGDRLRAERGVDLTARIGVNTGEAVTGAAPAGGFFTAGDAINVAARLEQAAAAGDVLLGRDTFRLVRHAVDAEPIPPLTLRGKRDAVEAHRLIAVTPGAQGRPPRALAPMVGRDAERQQLLDAFQAAVADRTCRLLTVVGAPGVGKSRLAAEVTAALSDAATVAAGRCLPYGEGLTWWPLTEALEGGELVRQLGHEVEPAVGRAIEVLRPTGEPVSPAEAFWALRTALETLARRWPLVLVLDDLQWADSTFLDFLEHVAAWSRDAPLLLLGLARPELLELRPAWGAGALIGLEPLPESQAGDLLRHLAGATALDDATATHVLDVAGGNPFFVEEIVAMLDDDALAGRTASAIAVPPTIQALLTARLDRLDPPERAVIEAASIEGKEFARDRVRSLINGLGPSTGAHLQSLVRKDLIHPVRAGETFRFRHQLIRDAAYEGMPKSLRAELHERFADRLDASRPELLVDELVGHHLERAVLLRRELGAADSAAEALSFRAASSLELAARRAMQRQDPAAAIGLLERAAALVRSNGAALGALLAALGAALLDAGRLAEAERVLDEAIEHAPDARLEARARIEREFVRLETETSVGSERGRRVADEVLPTLQHEGDHQGQCRALWLRAQVAWNTGRVAAADAAWAQAADCARRAGDERALFDVLGWRATTAIWGPTPADDGIRRCREIRDAVASSPSAVAWSVNALAALHAMRGEAQVADRCLAEAGEILRELGSLRSSVSHVEALVRLLAGRPDLAEAPLRADVATLGSASAHGLLATTTAMLAQAVFAQGRLEEAGDLCRQAAELAASDDIFTQAIWRGVLARLWAREGRADEAARLAREAVALVDPTDLLSTHGDAMLDLADVLETNGRRDDALGAARAALSLFERKGNAVSAARARRLLGNHHERT